MIIGPFSRAEAQAWATVAHAKAAALFTAQDEDAWDTAEILTGLVPLELNRLLVELAKHIDVRAGVAAYCTAQTKRVTSVMLTFCGRDAELYQAALDACSTGTSNMGYNHNLINWRFFTVKNVATDSPAPSSEWVRHTVMILAAQFLKKTGADAIREAFSHLLGIKDLAAPVLGFLVEDAVLTALWVDSVLPVEVIAAMGLPTTGFMLKGTCVALTMRTFGRPPFEQSVEEPGGSAFLYIPTAYNYRDVDAVVVYETSGTWVVIGVQVTIRTAHAHRASLDFLNGHWQDFAPPDSVATAKRGLLWITPEPQLKKNSLPDHKVYKHQAHMSFRAFENWLGARTTKRCVGAGSKHCCT